MKTFELIEEYPNSPKLGTTVELIGGRADDKIYRELGNPKGAIYVNVDRYPRCWRNTENFIILSFTNTSNDIFTLRDDGLHYYKTWKRGIHGISKKNLLNWDHIKIHSVQRFSDGKVFTVGDSIIHEGWLTGKVIKSIALDRKFLGGIGLLTSEGSTYAISIKDLFPVEKKPLFTTEDGVEIFEGDYWYYLVIAPF